MLSLQTYENNPDYKIQTHRERIHTRTPTCTRTQTHMEICGHSRFTVFTLFLVLFRLFVVFLASTRLELAHYEF